MSELQEWIIFMGFGVLLFVVGLVAARREKSKK
jgi:type IV secretory pathway TrbD component